MVSPRQHSLVTRASLSIMVVAAIVGGLYLAIGYVLTLQRAQQEAQDHLHELLDTVERSASIACFLKDAELADEVAQGLLANRIVAGVLIQADEGQLARAIRAPRADETPDGPAMPDMAIVRQILSPFNPQEIVGTIHLVPDQAVIDRKAIEASLFTGALMATQIIALGLAVALVVFIFVTRPLGQVAAGLHTIPAEQGAHLVGPKGHEEDEIGELVRYINHLISRLLGLVDEERHLRHELGIEETRLRSIFENADTGLFLADSSGDISSCNPACMALMRQIDPAIRHDSALQLADLFGDASPASGLIERCQRDNRSISQELRIDTNRDDGTECWIQLTLTPIGKQGLQGVVNDISERKRRESQAVQAAMTDPLTGLLNRMGFVRGLGEQLAATSGESAGAFLMMIDLDRFKQVNDTYGHAAGDQILTGVAGQIKVLGKYSVPPFGIRK